MAFLVRIAAAKVIARTVWTASRRIGGPWCGVGTGVGLFGAASNSYACYSGWADYKARNGMVCDPGTVIKGGDGILYMCQ
jgi:hypothetical protein